MFNHPKSCILIGLSSILLNCTALAEKPAKPALNTIPDEVESGSVLNVSWNMWWGVNGGSWKVSANNVVQCGGNLVENGSQAQQGSCDVNLDSGSYTLYVSLCNQHGCTESDHKNVTVKSAEDNLTSTNPWHYLDNSEWLALKEGIDLNGYNKPYQNTTGKLVGGYFVEWGIYERQFYPKDIPVSNLTHIFYGFIPVCGDNPMLTGSAKVALDSQCANKEDYQVVIHDKFAALEKNDLDSTGKWDDPVKGIFAEMYRMKMTYPHIKILPSVGGWTLSDPLYDIGTKAGPRAVFIESIIDFIKQYDFFDGIDIDWEFPGGGGINENLGSDADAEGFATLMQELRAALDQLSAETGRTYELTAAVSGGVSKLSKINWEKAAAYMDYINVMSYDYYGAWNQVFGHQTGIYNTNTLATPIDGYSADEGISYLLNDRGVNAKKVTVGVAMYGRGWKGIEGGNASGPFVASASGGTGITGNGADGIWEQGIIDYKALEANMLGGPQGTGINGFNLFYDETAQASYVWNVATGTFISMDTARSVEAKGNYVMSRGLGGIFGWELDGDSGTILNAMHKGLGHPSGKN